MIRNRRGLTYIETMISTVIITFMIVASVNLMTGIYKNSLISQQKQYSLSLCSQQLDYLKSKGFNNLPPTPDSCIPDANFTNLTPLESCATGTTAYDTYHYVTVTSGTTQMTYKVYSCVEWAEEDGNGNIVGKPASNLVTTNPDIKQLTVIVTYNSSNMTKTSRLTSYLSDKTINLAGATVSGTIYKINAAGTPVAPGASSGAAVHFVGYSAYTGVANGATGAYTVSNVPPGSYTLYADGSGLSLTYYTSNPLSISETVTSVTGVNFSCPQVDGGIITGVAYISAPLPAGTPNPSPTATFTVTPAITMTTINIYGTGAMTGKTEDWSNPTSIHANDGVNASRGSGTDKRLYTEFDNPTPPANTCINAVRVNIDVGTDCSQNLYFNFTNNSGSTWADNSGGWTGSVTTNFGTITLPSGPLIIFGFVINPCYNVNMNTYAIDITSLYPGGWNWTNIANLGAVFRVSPGDTVYMDAAWLSVDYFSCPATFTPTKTPTSGPAATLTPTPTANCAVGADVASLDGISAMVTVGPSSSGCGFTISNVNCSSVTDTVISYVINPLDGKLYYASVTTTVAIGVTEYVYLYLSPTSGTTGIVMGFVKDSLGNFISGAEVDLSDVAGDSVSTFGGAYSFTSAVPGTNYTLKASKPGYTSASENLASVAGGAITNAGTITLTQSGSISGTITDSLTGLPMGGIFVSAADSGGNHVGSDAYSDSITGYYLITGIPVGSGYQVSLTIDTTSFNITYPVTSDKSWHNIVVTGGGTAVNTNFKVAPIYINISGSVQMDSLNLSQGVNVVIYPSSVTVHASDYHYDLTNVYQQYSGHSRVLYPSYGFLGQGDGSFNIKVPVNSTYDIYAYYSFISYTGTPLNMTKTVAKYYKIKSGVSVGTTSITGQTISGALGTWTAY